VLAVVVLSLLGRQARRAGSSAEHPAAWLHSCNGRVTAGNTGDGPLLLPTRSWRPLHEAWQAVLDCWLLRSWASRYPVAPGCERSPRPRKPPRHRAC